MRRVTRLSLDARTLRYLARQQTKVDAGSDVLTTWKYARATKAMENVAHTLRVMAGKRQRCMYCQDSRATQIDHFWPLAHFPERAFDWNNLLLACDGCNRRKAHRFDRNADGAPLLLDPTTIDPWTHLFFDAATGILTARYFGDSESPLGRHTTDSTVLPLNIEAICAGRQRTARNLCAAVVEYLSEAMKASDEAAIGKLAQAVLDRDDFGLAEWYLKHDGQVQEPFATLRIRHPRAWTSLRLVFA